MRRVSVIVATAVASIAPVLPANASAGISYKDASVDIAPGGQYQLSIGCEKKHVLGGGTFISVGGAVTNASYPGDTGDDPDTKPDDYWVGWMTNTTGIQATMTVYAICSKAKSRYAPYETDFPGGEFSTAQSCPEGSKATAAGVQTFGGVTNTYARTWAPYEFVSGLKTQVSGVFKGTGSTDIALTAVCSDDMKLSYERSRLKIPGLNGEQKFLKCPRGTQVVGGGGTQRTIGTGWELATTISIPSDTGQDADHKPDNAWRVSINNPSGEQRTVPVVAVCAR
jgi:hypothetical protein